MAFVYESAVIPAPPGDVWKVIGRFDGLAQWVPAVRSAVIAAGNDGMAIGSRREVITRDGARTIETLIDRREAERTITYRALETTLPMRNYESRITLLPATLSGDSFVVWHGMFDAEPAYEVSLKNMTAAAYRTGLIQLQRRFAGS